MVATPATRGDWSPRSHTAIEHVGAHGLARRGRGAGHVTASQADAIDFERVDASVDANPSASMPTHAGLEPTSPVTSPSLGFPSRVGRYVVHELVGQGGMGVVLRAVDPELGREVAIKLLHARLHASRTQGTARLLREAQALARLSHPNVVDVYDVGTAEGRVFIAMEYVRGPSLHAWLRTRPPLRAVVDAFVQAGEGLVAAHAAGLVHRDFKPANVLRGSDGRVRVADFGLAAVARGDEGTTTLQEQEGHLLDVRITATGLTVGTPAYMAPEAHEGKLVDAKSDQWSFCASFYEALYGERPFPASDARELVRQVFHDVPRVPEDVEVPSHLRALVLRGLLADPDARWPSMTALLERLRPRPRRSRRWLVVPVAAIGVAGLALWLASASSSEGACEQAAAAVAEVWSWEARGKVEQAFTRSEVPWAAQTWLGIAQTLDDHAFALARARQEACETSPAEGGDAAASLDRRVACLGRQLSGLRGLVSVLEQADAATVRSAVQAVGDLRSPSECEGDAITTEVSPPPPAIADAVERAHDDMARVRALLRAGSYDRARTLAQTLLADATALGYAPLVAEARHLHGKVLMADGDYERAEQELVEVRLAAAAVGDDPLVATVSTELAGLVGTQLRRPEDAERWARHAGAAIERLADPTDAQTLLDGTLGHLRQASGDFEAAREHYERALVSLEARLGPGHPESITMRSNLALSWHYLGHNVRARELLAAVLADRMAIYGPAHPEVSSTLGNLGVVEQTLGELPAAAEHTQQALDGLEASVGQEHPLYPQLLTNLANTEFLMGHFDEALRMHERAKTLLERSLGPHAFPVGRALNSIGAIEHRAQRHDEARRAFQQAREILEEHLRPDHPELAILLSNLAEVDRDTGHLDDALAGFDRALELLEGALGPTHPELAYPLAGRGQTYLMAERPAQALADLRRAVLLNEGAELYPENAARMRYVLGAALWDTGEHDEGMRMMEQVLADAQRLGDSGKGLAGDTETWLAEHSPSP